MNKFFKPALLSLLFLFPTFLTGCGGSDEGTVIGSGDIEGIESYRAKIAEDEAHQKQLVGEE